MWNLIIHWKQIFKGSETGGSLHLFCYMGEIEEVTFYQDLQQHSVWRDALKETLEHKVEMKNGFW